MVSDLKPGSWEFTCHSPKKKKGKRKKNRARAHLSAPLPSPLSVSLAARRTRRRRPALPRAGHPRLPCHRFTPPLALILHDDAAASSSFLPANPSSLLPPLPPPELRRPPRFVASGEPWLNSLGWEHLLPPLARFHPYPGLLPHRTGPPPFTSVRRRLAPSRRPAVAAPCPRRW